MPRTKVVRRLRVGLIVALVATATSVSDQAIATPPGQNGRIVFRRYLNAAWTRGALFSVRDNGIGERRITHPGPKVLDNDPDVSPSGRWIVYAKRWQRRRTSSGDPRGALFRIRVNGTHRKNLTGETCLPEDDCLRDFVPNWSPDGRHIAFSRVFRSETREWEIDLFVMRADGTHLRQITAPGPLWEDYDPEWAPDGKRLVFFRADLNRDESANSALFMVHPDGTHLRQLTTYSLNPAQGQDWSPNGRWIAFSAWPAGQTYNLRMIHPNGTGLHRITNATNADWLRPCFSPDGTRIVSARSSGVGGEADVYVMHLDGSHKRNITRSESWDSAPDWGPRKT
jgi:TolB protein